MDKQEQYYHKLEYNNKYNKDNYKSFSFRLNNKNEAEMIAWLTGKDSLKQYISELVLADMKKHQED